MGKGLLLLALPAILALPVSAQDAARLFAEDLASAGRHLARGRLTKAGMVLEELLLPPAPEEPPEERVPAGIRHRAGTMRARIHLMKGELDRAEQRVAAILAAAAHHLPALLLRGDLHFARGRYRQARRAYAAAADLDPLNTESRFKRGLAAWTLGARREARETWEGVATLSRRHKLTRAADLLFLGRSLERLEYFEEASERYLEAARLDPLDHRAPTALGNLYFKVYGEVEGFDSGSKEFNRVLRPDRGDPGYVPALLGQLRIYTFNPFLDQRRVEGMLRRIYRRDPGLPEALALEAKILIGDRRYPEAERKLAKALERNPNHLPALAQLYALHHLRGEKEKAAARRKQALEIHPGHPGPDTALGLQLIRHYRFPGAIPHLRRALASRPRHVPALEGLGKALIYCGEGKEAKEVLAKAQKIQEGFVNAWRNNAITLQKRIDREYEVVTRGRFRFHLHPEGAPVLLAFLPAIYEEALDSYGRRYGIVPEGPIHVEVFHEYGDFSVRTIGFTGFGALGACFGQVITAVSPAAVEVKGRFSWGATAWHELAHTVTLSLSDRRIPRWLTEGISVREERVYDPAQERHMEDQLVSDIHNGTLPEVMKFDSWFRGPRVVYAYFLAGLAVEMLLEEKDFPALVRLCRAYARELNTDQALRQAYGLSAEAFDGRFRSWLERHVAPLALRPRPDGKRMKELEARLLLEPGDRQARLEKAWGDFFAGRRVDAGTGLARLLKEKPKDPAAQLLRGRLAFALGNMELAEECLEQAFAGGQEDFHGRLELARIRLRQKRRAAALEQFEAAHRAWPTCTDPQLSPLLARARLYAAQQRPEQEAAELERFIAVAGDAREPRLELAARKGAQGDRRGQARLLRQALHIDPFDTAGLTEYGLALQALERREEALRVLAAALAVPAELDANRGEREGREKTFRARILAARASLLLDLGRRAEAAQEARRALAEAPDSPGGRRAASILEKSR